KFDPQLIERGIADYMMLARLAPKEEGREPDITVLPETVVPLLQDRVHPQVWSNWIDIAREHGTTLLMGVPLHDRKDGRDRYTNSVIAFDENAPAEALMPAPPSQRYANAHLVTLGAFRPTGFRWFVDPMSIPQRDFDRAQGCTAP